jgi:hypothetical protein
MKDKKPKSDTGKKSWPGMSQNPFSLSQPNKGPKQFQVKQVMGRRSQRGR